MCPCNTRVYASFWNAVGVPVWCVRVTSVVPHSYCPPLSHSSSESAPTARALSRLAR